MAGVTAFDKVLALIIDLLGTRQTIEHLVLERPIRASPEDLLLHCYLADCLAQKYLCRSVTETVWSKQQNQPANPNFWQTYQRYLRPAVLGGSSVSMIRKPEFATLNPDLDNLISTIVRCSVAKHFQDDQQQLLIAAQETEPMQKAAEGQILDLSWIPESKIMQKWRLSHGS